GTGARRSDDVYASDVTGLERPLRAPARQALDMVQRRHRPDSDLSLAIDARVSAPLRSADVSLLGLERPAVAGLLLLARGFPQAFRAVWRCAHESGPDAGAGPRHAHRREDADHPDPYRPRVRRDGPGADARARRAAVGRRYDRVLGRRSADHGDFEYPKMAQPAPHGRQRRT